MKVLAELPHPDCKISIFSMNQKFIIKFEKGPYEQTYKLAEVAITDEIQGVLKVIDQEFIATVLERFTLMRADFNKAYKRFDYL